MLLTVACCKLIIEILYLSSSRCSMSLTLRIILILSPTPNCNYFYKLSTTLGSLCSRSTTLDLCQRSHQSVYRSSVQDLSYFNKNLCMLSRYIVDESAGAAYINDRRKSNHNLNQSHRRGTAIGVVEAAMTHPIRVYNLLIN